MMEYKVPKLQYFGHLMRRVDSVEKTLMLGKTEGGRRRGRQRMRWLDGNTDSMVMSWLWVNSGSWWWTGRPGRLRYVGSQRVGHDWATELNWTGPSSPKIGVFLLVWRLLLSLSVHRPPLITRGVVSSHLAPDPISLLKSSYPPTVTPLALWIVLHGILI